MMKRCLECRSEKPIDAFYKRARKADGYLNKCKDCINRYARQYRLKNPERLRGYDRTRNRRPHRIASRRADYEREWREHPERMQARNAVNDAVRDGRMTKLPCAFCRSDENLEAHHHDYAKPLDVTWLCKPCHRRFHALERMATYGRRQWEAKNGGEAA